MDLFDPPGARSARGARAIRAAALTIAVAVTLPLPSPASGLDVVPPSPIVSSPPRDHPDPTWLVGGQLTSTGVLVPGLRSPYRSPGVSFGEDRATAGWSLVVTGLAGVRPWEGAVIVAQPEFSDGAGAPNVSGVAGYVDGNIIRVAKVGKEPYLARAFFQQDIALGAAEESEEGAPEDRFMPTGPLALGRSRPASRIEVTAGKFAATDFFDVAGATTDPRHRFLNWSLMTNGAWDFAADTRGYTWGLVVAVETPRWAVRGGEAMMPTTPNGPVLDGDLAHARSDMVEAVVRHQLLGSMGAVKLLAYQNHARMGAFADALAAAPAGQAPSIDAVARRGAVKRGLGLLVDQRLGSVSAFLRASWNDGRTEEYAFTQIERAVSAGAEIPTDGWGRAGDHVGLGAAANGLSPSHVRYLRAGGADFQLGDGALRYRPEVVVEAYYALHAGRTAEITADVQGIVNPGMNADRGPALAFGLRFHAHI